MFNSNVLVMILCIQSFVSCCKYSECTYTGYSGTPCRPYDTCRSNEYDTSWGCQHGCGEGALSCAVRSDSADCSWDKIEHYSCHDGDGHYTCNEHHTKWVTDHYNCYGCRCDAYHWVNSRYCERCICPVCQHGSCSWPCSCASGNECDCVCDANPIDGFWKGHTCSECYNGFDIDKSCRKCVSTAFRPVINQCRCFNNLEKGFWMGDYCKSCFPRFDSATHCTACTEHAFISYNNQTQHLPDIETNTTIVVVLGAACTCYSDDNHGYWAGNCETCQHRFNISTDCKSCVNTAIPNVVGPNQTKCICAHNWTTGFWDGVNCERCSYNLLDVKSGCRVCKAHASPTVNEASPCSCNGIYTHVGDSCTTWPFALSISLSSVALFGICGYILKTTNICEKVREKVQKQRVYKISEDSKHSFLGSRKTSIDEGYGAIQSNDNKQSFEQIQCNDAPKNPETKPPPFKETAPPYEEAPPPFKETAPSYEGTAPPFKETAPPNEGTTSPFKETSPPYEGTAPPFKETALSNKGTTSSCEGTVTVQKEPQETTIVTTPHQEPTIATVPYNRTVPIQKKTLPYQHTTRVTAPYNRTVPVQKKPLPYQHTTRVTRSDQKMSDGRSYWGNKRAYAVVKRGRHVDEYY